MIVGERKGLEEILDMIEGARKLLIAGCGTCVTISFAGGAREVSELASAIKLALKKDGRDIEIQEQTTLRQCEIEFVKGLSANITWSDAVLSLACGVGVQTMAETFPKVRILPGINTMMIGSHSADRVFKEYCGACGDCILDETGGICPIVRCSKSMLNGPCGGSRNGKCEVSPEIDCGWQLIYDKLKELGLQESWSEIKPPKDWSTSWHGGPRKLDKSVKFKVETPETRAAS